ncbi:hypothetical protein A3J32_03035 [Candidatus Saccharibacteria bacterium RIFCSPLOWO2_02_FULL_46_7]|nr:MAG: hypothetical protein A3J32_03035 [Candidatus Saccharibacteria bacterium RIFCSPLOWO2_02_FULL_46_7]
MKQADQPATRGDVQEIVTKIVTVAIDSSTKQILGAVGDQFEIVNDRLDGIENQLDIIQTDSAHARNISQATSDRVDRHEKRLKFLEPKAKIS